MASRPPALVSSPITACSGPGLSQARHRRPQPRVRSRCAVPRRSRSRSQCSSWREFLRRVFAIDSARVAAMRRRSRTQRRAPSATKPELPCDSSLRDERGLAPHRPLSSATSSRVSTTRPSRRAPQLVGGRSCEQFGPASRTAEQSSRPRSALTIKRGRIHTTRSAAPPQLARLALDDDFLRRKLSAWRSDAATRSGRSERAEARSLQSMQDWKRVVRLARARARRARLGVIDSPSCELTPPHPGRRQYTRSRRA